MSIVSTTASDNLTLLPSDPIEAKHEPNEPADAAMDVDGLEDEGHQVHSSPSIQHRKLESIPRVLSMNDEHEEDKELPHNVVKQPNGVVIIEKLDTPATRREKNLRRKAEKQKMAAQANEAISAGSSTNLSVTQPTQPSPLPATSQVHRPLGLRQVDDMESELSELSDLASEEPEKVEITAAAMELKDGSRMDEVHAEITNKREEPQSPSRPEQFPATKDKDKAKAKEPITEGFPGGTLGKSYDLNDIYPRFLTRPCCTVWAKAGKSNKWIAKDTTYFLRFAIRLVSLVARCGSHTH